MILAVTGATGFVGQAVLDEATQRGIAVRALTRRTQPTCRDVDWISGDLGSHDALAELVHGADAVLHIAGVVNAADMAGFHAGNVAGTEAVVAAAEASEAKRFVHVSSLAAREPGLSDYGKSKQQAEEAVRASSLDWTMVRPPAVYGPRDTEVFELFKAARFGFVPLPPEGRSSVIHVDDLARLLLDMVGEGAETFGKVYEPDDGTPKGLSHSQLAEAIGAAMGKRVWAPNVPRSLLMAAAKGDRLLRGAKAKLTPDRASYMCHPDWVSDPEKAVPSTIWQPQVRFPEGLAQTAEWYRDAGWL
ncbi:NAD-dependent epimerase/dehydratase family protein [Aurantiacibacter gilvus]|uniref:NAD(P)H-binding protein n=1 Tax=Aurantiacibacter gilvus TaxID=3139141 RepID=A0ABU9IAV6_9SPHN